MTKWTKFKFHLWCFVTEDIPVYAQDKWSWIKRKTPEAWEKIKEVLAKAWEIAKEVWGILIDNLFYYGRRK